jgi:hypothetical protein
MNTDPSYTKKRELEQQKNFNKADKNGTGILNEQEFLLFNEKEVLNAEKTLDFCVKNISDLDVMRD